MRLVFIVRIAWWGFVWLGVVFRGDGLVLRVMFGVLGEAVYREERE